MSVRQSIAFEERGVTVIYRTTLHHEGVHRWDVQIRVGEWLVWSGERRGIAADMTASDAAQLKLTYAAEIQGAQVPVRLRIQVPPQSREHTLHLVRHALGCGPRRAKDFLGAAETEAGALTTRTTLERLCYRLLSARIHATIEAI
jgi:hypothetical protein